MLLILLILLILLNEMPPERRVLRKVSRTVRRACCETCGMPHPSGDQGLLGADGLKSSRRMVAKFPLISQLLSITIGAAV